ncbi:MAG: hypothetical protein ACXIU7_00575 [Roseinatronobacter sp.]
MSDMIEPDTHGNATASARKTNRLRALTSWPVITAGAVIVLLIGGFLIYGEQLGFGGTEVLTPAAPTEPSLPLEGISAEEATSPVAPQ